MRLLIQRVKEASVGVNEKIVGKIGPGLLVFFGAHKDDTPEKTAWLADKLFHLRIFRDASGKMNHDVREAEGKILVVSQFTLYGDCSSGRRPEFTQAALPEPAFLLYEKFLSDLRHLYGESIETGTFGALMEVSLINDGPVTFLLER